MSNSRCLVITGMPGSGKSAVARLIARRTDRELVDLDELIARRAGATIPEIFATEGEAGFRKRERQAVAELVGLEGAVIATGGWTFGDGASRDALEALGVAVCLTADVETLARRLDASGEVRPMLVAARPTRGSALEDPEAQPAHGDEASSTNDLGQRIRALLRRRQGVYDAIPLQVETSTRSVEQSADEVLALVDQAGTLPLRSIPVATPGVYSPAPAVRGRRAGYGVVIGRGAFDALGALLRGRGLASHAVIVTDENVNALYGARAMHQLEAVGARVSRVELPPGEGSKSLQTLSDLYNAFVAAGVERDTTVIALGGGVVGDIAGFAAATFMRGLTLAFVPTTVLAMADSSIGGKTGVNLAAGKNLVGAFKQPAVVITDPELLATLDRHEIHSGLAEVLKAAVIGDTELFEELSAMGTPGPGDVDRWTEIITRASMVKARIVSEDPLETGIRAVLNLGHTVGHALEAAADYAISHGQAIAVGMVAAARLSERLGHAQPGLADRLQNAIEALGLPVRFSGPAAEELLAAMASDKKRRTGRLRMVLPHEVGDVRLVDDVPAHVLLEVLEALRVSADGGRQVLHVGAADDRAR